MAATYPASVRSFSTKANGQVITPAFFNDLQEEVVAIETGLLNGIDHALRPLTTLTRDLGTSSFRWRDIFGKQINVDPGSLTADAQQIRSSVTWNNAGVTFIHQDSDVTDTASAAASLLARWRVGGSFKVQIRKDGLITSAFGLDIARGAAAEIGTTDAFDLILKRSNTEEARIVAGGLRIGATVADAGNLRLPSGGSVRFRNAANTGNISLLTTGADKFQLDADLIPNIDGATDFGSSTNRWRDIHLFTSVRVGATPATGGAIRLPAGGGAAGGIFVRNNANTANRRVFTSHEVGTDEQIFGDDAVIVRIRSNLATPTGLGAGDWWVDATGVSPTRVLAIKVFDGGAVRTIASVTY